MQSKIAKDENANLFTVTNRGDISISRAKSKATILVGKSRIGKSTMYNWIIGKPMIGKGPKNSSQYVSMMEDGTAAKTSSSYLSVTLSPNVHVDLNEDESLIDMPGFDDSRNYVGTIGVSYFLKAVFAKIRQLKFIIVIDEHSLSQPTGKEVISTFQGFINMFHFDKMDEQTRTKLKKSIGLVITRTSHASDHYEYFQNVISRLNCEELVIENKELIIDLLNHVVDEGKNDEFAAAVAEHGPEPCTFMKRWQQLGWSYFNLDEADAKAGQSIIAIPLEKEFQKLNSLEQKKFTEAIQTRAASYAKFSKILEVMNSSFVNNWTAFISTWKSERKINWGHFQMKETFEKIEEFLQENDVYDSKSIVETSFKIGYQPLKLTEAVNAIAEICRIVVRLTCEAEFLFEKVMEVFDLEFGKLVSCLGKFAESNAQELLIQRLKYVLGRGFREFAMLFSLKPESVTFFRHNLVDNLNSHFQEQQQICLERIIKEMSPDLLPEAFPDVALLEDYQRILEDHESKYSDMQDPSFFSDKKCGLGMAKADILSKNGQNIEALQSYCTVIKIYDEICQPIQKSDQDNKENELTMLSMKKMKLLKRIIAILKTIPEKNYFNPKGRALELCKYYKCIDLTCQIYQLLVDSTTVSSEKCCLYRDFAAYCKDWGRIEQAVILLQKKMDLEDEEFDNLQSTSLEIKAIMDSRQDLYKAAAAKYKQWERLPGTDEAIQVVFNEIDAAIPRYLQEEEDQTRNKANSAKPGKVLD